MKISIVGLGFFGVPLARKLISQEHILFGTTRSEEKKKSLETQGLQVSILDFPHAPSTDILESDLIVLNIPPFEKELEWFKSWSLKETATLIFISSTSVENNPNKTNAKLLAHQEEWIKTSFSKWSILRFGGLIGRGRHPAKYLSGKKNIPGRLWPINLLDVDFAVDYVCTLIATSRFNQVEKVLSLTGLTKEEYYINYCKENDLPLPEFDQGDESLGPTN